VSTPSLASVTAAGLVSEGDLARAQELVAELKRSSDMIAFVGAGVSKAAGYPTWDQLLNNLHKELSTHLSQEATQSLDDSLTSYQDMLWRAEEYRLRAGKDDLFLQMLARAISSSQFDSLQASPLPRQIVSLPFRHFLTTNYDDCLEKASRQLDDPSLHLEEFCWTGVTRDSSSALVRLRTTPRKVIHVHGTCSIPNSMILTNRDYTSFYLSTDRHAKQLFAIFATYRLCFLGFSLTDPHILRLLDQVEALGHEGPRHVAILCDPGKDVRAIYGRMLEKRYGVSPIFYREGSTRSNGGKYRFFPQFIAALAAAVSNRDPQLEAASRRSLGPYPTPSKAIKDPDDLNRGRFGRSARRDGLILSATVVEDSDDDEWFDIKLSIKRDPEHPGRALDEGSNIELHLHDTFPKSKVLVRVKKGRAEYRCYAWGAFTVGAVVPGRTCLELDLSRLEHAPPKFRGR